jgi:hypothetical protein
LSVAANSRLRWVASLRVTQASGSCGLEIDVGLRKFTEQRVGLLFLLERFIEKGGDVLHAELGPIFSVP